MITFNAKTEEFENTERAYVHVDLFIHFNADQATLTESYTFNSTYQDKASVNIGQIGNRFLLTISSILILLGPDEYAALMELINDINMKLDKWREAVQAKDQE